ncbi:hypothetical protein [Devosia sp.]|uniref:hypothetical protein n=1 Tax=Devosia sp. TaxID=1871048 RepID=UPI00260BB294|nr:hypothetical protein [Devosia sp.]
MRPLIRQTAHQLTLLGLCQDSEEFSTKWLGDLDAYRRLSGFSLLELASVVHSLEFGLGLQECVYQDDWEEAKTDRDRWQARVRLSTLRLQLTRLRRWKRDSGWQTVMFD